MKLRKGPYQPQQGDKITINKFLHVIISDVLSCDDANYIFEDDKMRRFNVEGFRQSTNGECKPYDDEMSAKEIEKLLSAKGGRVYREDKNEEMTVVLSAS